MSGTSHAIGDTHFEAAIAAGEALEIVDLRTEDASGLVACGVSSPRLSWRVATQRAGIHQLGYELQLADEPAFTVGVQSSGVVQSTRPFLARWPGAPLNSREIRWWRVRVNTNEGWTDWSAPSVVEGTLSRSDWIARPVSPLENTGRPEGGPTPLLRREFVLNGAAAKARLYVSALGVYEVRINGHRISDDLLEPGWTVYPERLLFASYDVTPLLRESGNAITGAVGEGWWRGEQGWMKQRAMYGDTTALLAQLEIETTDGQRAIIATDGRWRGSFGGLRMAELYHGVDEDLRLEPVGWELPGFDDSDWEAVTELDLPPVLEQRTFPAVRPLKTFPPISIHRTDRTVRVDAGQNLAGYLRLRVVGERGCQITVRHAEVRRADGALHTAPLRNARATDTYILKNLDAAVLEPRFTFHGFRYAEIDLPPEVTIESVEVVAIGTALSYTGEFSCSNALLNQLYHNAVWSQRANFLALPTDCPQRDERLGWTGDIQVFAETACLVADCSAFLASWLKDLALEQRADGAVPSTIPNIIQGHEFEYGGVGWGDAATLVPWALYTASGDLDILARQFESMCAWVDYGTSRLNDAGIWEGDFHLGDWLDPNAPPDRPECATTDRDFVASAYLARSARVLARAADLLEKDNDARRYQALGDRVARAAWKRWASDAVKTQTGCAIAIMFEIAPASERNQIGEQLAALVNDAGGRIGSGFLGTPLILPALTATNQTVVAYRLLLNRECPGWLFQVEQGATTVWERWDAIRSDGSIHEGEMNTGGGASMTSFNHYAYGAVAAWMFRSLAGLAPQAEHPGFEHVVFAPTPGGGISSASASLVSPFGRTTVEWELQGSSLRVAVQLPPGSTGVFVIPDGYDPPGGERRLALSSGKHSFLVSRRR